MKVEMLSIIAGPGVDNAGVGDVIEVEAARGKELIESGHAKATDKPLTHQPAHPSRDEDLDDVETATEEAPETAASPRRGRRS